MSELLISHAIDKSFLKYGFVISKNQVHEHLDMIVEAYTKHTDVKVNFKGKQYSVNIDHGNGREGLYRVMFKKELREQFLKEYEYTYESITNPNGKSDIKIKEGVNVVIGLYSTAKEYVWDAIEIIEDSKDYILDVSTTRIDSVPYPEQKIYYGAPGCGKSHYINSKLKKYSFDISKLTPPELQGKFEEYLHCYLSDITSRQYKKSIVHPDFISYIQKESPNRSLKNVKSIFEIRDASVIEEIPTYNDFDKMNRKSTVSSNGSLSACLTKYSAFLKSDNKSNIFRTTFHPDYDFSSFVGTYKPVMADKDGKRTIEYNFAPQIFTDAYVYAWKNPAIVVFLIIEEINRGNCAQIFGDLFQLLDRSKSGESEYPIKANIDLRRYLEEDGQLGLNGKGIENGELKLPRNLNILATMNTSDQSLFPMDSAFKRRWQWKYMKIDYNNPESDEYIINIDDDHLYKWNDFLIQVNKRIYDLTKSEDKQIGNFFVKGEIDTETFIEKVMFFLWSEVCKEEVGNKRSFYFTTHRFDEDTPEGQDKWEFKFSDLFRDDATDILIGFMDFLKVDKI